MKRFVLISLLVIVLCAQLGAKHSDEFLIGTYSYIRNSFPYYLENRELFSRWMRDMGYNSNIMETDLQDPDLPGLLEIQDNFGIDAWVTDRGFEADPSSSQRYAITPLATSSYQRFEAEYYDEREVKPGDGRDSRFWYSSRSDKYITRVGKAEREPEASNGFVWKASRKDHPAGYAMGDLRYRWPNINGAYVRLGYEFHHYQMNPPDYEGEYLWITYRFRISNPAPAVRAGDPLVRFELAGYELADGSFSSQATVLRADSEKGFQSRTDFSLQDYQRTKSADGYATYVLKVPYKELVDANLLRRPNHLRMVMNNFNPRLWWYGNCDIELDYVQIQDQMSYELMNADAQTKQKIIDRAHEVIEQGRGNVSGFYAYDEPFQGQYRSFGFLNDLLAEEDLRIMTASYDFQSSNIVIDKDKNIFYDHLDAFLKEAQPLVYAPDIYPVKPRDSFVPGVKGREFLQDVLNYKLLPVYEKGLQYRLEDPRRRFYPIVQAFGRWAKGNPDHWTSWVMPPYATQKMLMYLPLVYQADGVFHYRLQSYQTGDGYGDYVGLNSQLQSSGSYSPPSVAPNTMDAILHSNPKVFEYGRIIRDLTWVDAATIMTKGDKKNSIPESSLITSMHVLNQPEAPYSGYIQCGFYLDEEENPYLMLVNRRGNYFEPSDIGVEEHVPPQRFEEHFPQADPQTLIVTFGKEARRRYGEYIGFWDPWDDSISYFGKLSGAIEIPAGEARLLKLVKTTPPILKGKNTFKGERSIRGEVILDKNAKLTLHKNSKLTLEPGSRLIVPRGASITLSGEIDLKGDAELILLGYVREKKLSIIAGKDARIVDDPQPTRNIFKRLFGIK